jgi:hypothetical protein
VDGSGCFLLAKWALTVVSSPGGVGTSLLRLHVARFGIAVALAVDLPARRSVLALATLVYP